MRLTQLCDLDPKQKFRFANSMGEPYGKTYSISGERSDNEGSLLGLYIKEEGSSQEEDANPFANVVLI